MVTDQLNAHSFPREVPIELAESGLPRRSVVILNQIHSVDRLRHGRKMGPFTVQSMKRVDEALKISLGLTEL